MPIWLRRFTYTKLQEYYDNQNKEYEKASKKYTNSPQVAKGPNIKKPTYTTKAGK
jgi:hypothetical protein